MAERFDVIVLGMGSMGSAACAHLARRGVRVLGIERFAIPHAHGSGHGHSRALRLAYYEHPDYVPLLRRAHELWDELEGLSGKRIVHRCGGLYMGPPESELVSGSLGSARLHGIPHELLDRAALAQRYPQFDLPDDFVGFLETQAGAIVPEMAIGAHVEVSLRAGASVHAHERALSWEACEAGVTVRTDRGVYEAGSLVITAGAWAGEVLGSIGVPLEVSRQVLAWFWPGDAGAFGPDRFPMWGIEHEGALHYGFPVLPESPGLKIARHAPGPVVEPLSNAMAPTRADEDMLRPVLRRWLRVGGGQRAGGGGEGGDLLALRACLYTSTPDGHFVVDRHPAHRNVVIAAGFSGHGFKFASVLGEVLAGMAVGEDVEGVGFLGLGRF